LITGPLKRTGLDRFFGTKMDRSKIAEIQAMGEEIDRRLGPSASSTKLPGSD